MADLVCYRGTRREYLVIEHDPHMQLPGNGVTQDEIWRIALPAGMSLKQARKLYANGVRPKPSQLKPSLQRKPKKDPQLFTESGLRCKADEMARQQQTNWQTFTPEGRAILERKT